MSVPGIETRAHGKWKVAKEGGKERGEGGGKDAVLECLGLKEEKGGCGERRGREGRGWRW